MHLRNFKGTLCVCIWPCAKMLNGIGRLFCLCVSFYASSHRPRFRIRTVVWEPTKRFLLSRGTQLQKNRRNKKRRKSGCSAWTQVYWKISPRNKINKQTTTTTTTTTKTHLSPFRSIVFLACNRIAIQENESNRRSIFIGLLMSLSPHPAQKGMFMTSYSKACSWHPAPRACSWHGNAKSAFWVPIPHPNTPHGHKKLVLQRERAC